MIWRILLYSFLIYLLYKLVFKFIIPVFKTTRKIKKDFKEMQSRMNLFMNNQQEEKKQQTPPGEPSTTKRKPGDYIDFEEIK